MSDCAHIGNAPIVSDRLTTISDTPAIKDSIAKTPAGLRQVGGGGGLG
jgi:hypothetical protein